MRDKWRTVSLGDAVVSDDSKRKPVKSADRRPGPYPYWGASGVVDWVDEFIFDYPTMLVSEDGENLKTRKTPIAFLADGRYWVNNHAHVLRAADGFDLRFLTYAVGLADISGFLTGSTQPKLTAGNLARIPLQVPGLDEQRRIAGVLGAMDDLIEVNEGLARDCEALAQSLAATPEKMTPLSAFTKWGGLSTMKPSGLVAHYSLPAFDDGRQPELVDGSSIKSNKQKLDSPCVLVSRLNPHIPRVWMAYPESEVTSLASTEFVPIFGDGVENEVVYATCSAASYLDSLGGLVTGTTGSHQRVDKDALTSVVVPDVRTLDARISEAIRDLIRQAQACREEMRDLSAARDELLPLLMSGRVRVGELAA